jgi:hypothetical protein
MQSFDMAKRIDLETANCEPFFHPDGSVQIQKSGRAGRISRWSSLVIHAMGTPPFEVRYVGGTRQRDRQQIHLANNFDPRAQQFGLLTLEVFHRER